MKRLYYKIKQILILAINLMILMPLVSSIANEQNVTVSITPKPKIDIALAKGISTTDVTNFKDDIINGLKAQNIDTSNVNVFSVEATASQLTSEDVNVDKIINNWETVGASTWSSTNGQIYSKVPGGSSKPSWWGTGLLDPDGYNTDQVTMDFTMVTGGKLNEGVCFNVTKNSDGSLNGYFVTICNHSNSECRLWRFDHYTLDQAFDSGINKNIWCNPGNPGDAGSWTVGHKSVYGNDSFTCLAAWTTGSSNIPYHIEYKNGHILINASGNKVVDMVENTYKKGTYGFWGNNCETTSYMYITGIKISTIQVKAKKLEEVLREPKWREGSLRFLINVTDKSDENLANGNSTYGELITRLMNDSVYFVTWGNNVNKEQFTNLITQSNNKGKFINNTNYNTSITETSKYVRSVLDLYQDSEYVIVNEPVSISVNPESARNNTKDSTWPYGKWKIIHDYEYFENNMGQFADSGKYVDNFITTFDKTGRYEFTFRDLPITPKYVYVHRRPVASFIMKLNNGAVTLDSNSYDLDMQSKNNGISEEEWTWKTSDETNWHSGKLTSYAGNKIYIIKLRVKDFQNTWSEPTTKYIYNGSTSKPVAMFTINEETITKYEQLSITDQSYDPSGKTLTKYAWEIYQGTTKVYSGSMVPTDFKNYALGNYTLSLTVTNSNNVKSETVSRPFTIINDLIAPEVVVTPVECDWKREQKVNLQFSDKGGSKFKHYKYAITDSQAAPSSWSSPITESTSSIIINQEGVKYLHIIAEDNAGNVSKDRICGPYKVDRTGPTLDINVDLKTITTKNLPMKVNAVDNLSGIKSIVINGVNYNNNSQYEIAKNGIYTIVAIDNVGNQTSKDIVVDNVYRICTEGLNHPIYSSTYDECPICKLVKNIKMGQTTFTYDTQEHCVQYENPDKAPIKEYYNGSEQLPKDVGKYQYKLNVVYEGKEYDTHFKGDMYIIRKSISIKGIKATNRQYNGTNIISLSGGILDDVEEKDKDDVGFILPKEGTTESKNVGKYNVKVPQIELIGEKSSNYNLIQPSIEDVTVEIIPKDITIENIKAENRQYNGTKKVALSEGTLQGIEKIDNGKVEFLLANEGTIENKNIGKYNVKIPNIELIGEESKNYNLIQPDIEDVTVEISPKDITIENIKAQNRQYNGTNIVELSEGKLQVIEEIDKGKVNFVLPKEGTIESENIGKYNVKLPNIELIGEESQNYNLIQPKLEDVLVEINPKDITIKNIKAQNREYDGTTIVNISGGNLQGVEEKDKDNMIIDFILPKEGTVEKKDVGTYKVKVPNIELTGEKSKNYNLIQPGVEDVEVKIMPKELTIINVNGVDKLYDRSSKVKVEGGELEGIVEGEEVKAKVPEEGEAESDNVGNWGTKIGEIELEGADANNYVLKQPEEKDIRVNILEPDKPALYMETEVEKINGKDYKESKKDTNKTKEDSKLETKAKEETNIRTSKNKVRVQSNDIVTLKIRITNKGEGAGYAKSVKVQLPETAKIVKNDEINKKYGWQTEKNNVVTTQEYCLENGKENELPGKELDNSAKEKDNNNTEDKDKDKELVLELNIKIGDLNNEYQDIPIEIEAEQTDINNTVVEDKIKGLKDEIILRSNYAKLTIEKTIYAINGKEIGEETKKKIAQGEYELEVEPKDVITYKIKVTNEGEIDCYASKIEDIPEEGLEYIPENGTNKKYSWKMLDKNGKETEDITKAKTYESDYLKDKIIKGLGEQEEKEEQKEQDKTKEESKQEESTEKKEKEQTETKENYKEILISFKVKETDKKDLTIGNTANITEIRDERGNVIEQAKDKNGKNGKGENGKSTEGKNSVKIKVKYFDLSLNGIATKMEVYENGQLVTTETNDVENKILKAEVKKKKVNTATIKVEYTIFVKNEGEIEGTATEIKDYIPKGFIFKQEDNKKWKEIGNNVITTNELANETIKPDETKTVKLVLRWKNALDNFGSFTNAEEISKENNVKGTKDIDSIPDNKNVLEDDYSSQRVIIAQATGKTENMIHLLTALILTIFSIAILACIIKIVKLLK